MGDEMKREDFTVNIAKLIMWIKDQGWYCLLDFGLRSAEEQHRLFLAGASRDDGIKNISQHQRGKAEDIYIHNGDGNINKKEYYDKAHAFWTSLGGDPMINIGTAEQPKWDMGHFQVH